MRHGRLLIMNGPNLNMLGTREPGLYGADTLADVERIAGARAEELGYKADFFQSNWEGALIDRLHEARGSTDGVVLNPAAFTHTSVALRDALLAAELPVVEVHVSNVHKREEFPAPFLRLRHRRSRDRRCGHPGVCVRDRMPRPGTPAPRRKE
jgi:3-dehydroquinate dehydratase-2